MGICHTFVLIFVRGCTRLRFMIPTTRVRATAEFDYSFYPNHAEIPAWKVSTLVSDGVARVDFNSALAHVCCRSCAYAWRDSCCGYTPQELSRAAEAR